MSSAMSERPASTRLKTAKATLMKSAPKSTPRTSARSARKKTMTKDVLQHEENENVQLTYADFEQTPTTPTALEELRRDVLQAIDAAGLASTPEEEDGAIDDAGLASISISSAMEISDFDDVDGRDLLNDEDYGWWVYEESGSRLLVRA